MRSRNRQLYDKAYYGFERWLSAKACNYHTRKSLRGAKFDRSFYQEYKKSIRPYWQQFGIKHDIVWAKYYFLLTGSMDPRYIPGDLYAQKIIPYFNRYPYMGPLADKNLNSTIFPNAKRPETIFKYIFGTYRLDDFTIISQEEAMARLKPDQRYVIKPTRHSNGGKDIQVFSGDITPENFAAILKPYSGDDYIVQGFITQHPDLAKLNPTSVNTIRISTMLFRGKPYILPSAILRVGGTGSLVDNVGAGGYQCPIQPDGTLAKTAFTQSHTGNKLGNFVEETSTGLRFADCAVPSYDKVCSMVLDLAAHIPHLRYIAWDIAVDKSGDPILIEFNVTMPGDNQENCGPTFGDMTEDVLEEIFGRH